MVYLLKAQFTCFIVVWFERSISESTDTRSSGTSQNTTQNSRTMSLDLEKQPSSLPGAGPTNSSSADPIRPRRTMKQAVPSQTNTKIMVVWLESLEDHIQFPIGSFILLSLNIPKVALINLNFLLYILYRAALSCIFSISN